MGDLVFMWRLFGVNYCDGLECDMVFWCVDLESEELKFCFVFLMFFSFW